VPMTQPAARVIFNWLEPEGPDSAVRWGWFNTIFEQKEYAADYVFEPIARELLARNPKLKAEFERRLAADADFAASPRARLQFLYEQTPYYEADKDCYPVVRVIAPLPQSGGQVGTKGPGEKLPPVETNPNKKKKRAS